MAGETEADVQRPMERVLSAYTVVSLFVTLLFFAAGVASVCREWWRAEQRRARLHFASFHGDKVTWGDLHGRSAPFLAEMIRLQHEVDKADRLTALNSVVHAYNPYSPFNWLCGGDTKFGRGVMHGATCPDCAKREGLLLPAPPSMVRS